MQQLRGFPGAAHAGALQGREGQERMGPHLEWVRVGGGKNARGGEAVILTENIRNYFDILVRYESAYRPLFSTIADDESQVAP